MWGMTDPSVRILAGWKTRWTGRSSKIATVSSARERHAFGTQHALYQRLLELFHQPTVTKQVFRPFAALQQFVQYGVADLTSRGPRCPFFSA